MNLQGILARLSVLAVAVSAAVSWPLSGAAAGICPEVTNAKAFFDTVRAKVHKNLSDDQLESYKCLFQYWKQLNLDDKRWLSYAMATAYHEARMAPLREGSGGHAKAIAAAKVAYDKGWTKRPYHLPDPATGKVYYGRGLVQLTWAANYQRMGQALGMGDRLYREPDLVLQPDIATKVMMQGMIQGKFCSENNAAIIKKCTGQARSSTPSRLGIYFNKSCAEWYRARRMINGDLAKTANHIAGYAKNYLAGLGTMPIPVSAGAGDVIVTQPALPEELPTPPEEEIGGIGPLLPDAPVTPAEETVTKPLTDTEGTGPVQPASDTGGGGAAENGTVAAIGDKPIVPASEEEIKPKLAPEDTLPSSSDGTGTVGAGASAGSGATTGGGSTAGSQGTVAEPDNTNVAGMGGSSGMADTATPASTGGMTSTQSGTATAGTETQVAQLDQGGTAVAGSAGQNADSEALKASLTADREAVAQLRASVAEAKQATADNMAATAAAAKAANDNKAALADVAKSVEANSGRLDEIGVRLQKMDATLAALAQQLAELKKPTSAPVAGGGSASGAKGAAPTPGESEPQGWFGKTVGTIKGYIWKAE